MILFLKLSIEEPNSKEGKKEDFKCNPLYRGFQICSYLYEIEQYMLKNDRQNSFPWESYRRNHENETEEML